MAGEERPGGGGDDKKSDYPLGFRFKPTLRELVEFYLLPKLLDKPTVPNDAIIEADAYQCDPEILTRRYEERGVDDNWHFLSPRSRRYPGGDRPTRRTSDDRGRWKPSTGQSKPGKNTGADNSKAKKGAKKNLTVGAVEFTENTLAYYVGEPRNETKTKWLMHELTVPEPEKEKNPGGAAGEKPRDHMLLNKYVLCRIYKSPLKKWRELEDGEASTSSAPAEWDDASTSSQSGSSAPESDGERSASTPMSKREGKRPAVEQPSAPNKRAFQRTVPPGPSPGPTTSYAYANGGGGGMRVPAGAGAAGYYHGVPGLPPLMQWPPATYSGMQGPVQLLQRQQPPLVYGHNVRPPVQGPPTLRLVPAHRAAAAAPKPPGRAMMMRRPNPAAGQPPSFPRPPRQPPPPFPQPPRQPPPPFPQPPRQPPQQQQQQQQQVEDEVARENRVFGQLLAEIMKNQQPGCFDEGANHPAGAETKVMVPRPQFQAPHNFFPSSGVQQQQQQFLAETKETQQRSAPCTLQQQMSTAMSTQPAACFDEGANHPAAGQVAMAPRPQFQAHHNLYPCSGVQQQQSSSAMPAVSVPSGAASAPVEAITPPATDDALSKPSVPGDANEGSGKGNCYYDSNIRQPFADFVPDLPAVEN